MELKTQMLYHAALKNDKFLRDIKDADNDNKPNLLSHENEKILFTAIYYGWLVGKYGNNWSLHLECNKNCECKK